jgi:uncharacterized integral membrane protein
VDGEHEPAETPPPPAEPAPVAKPTPAAQPTPAVQPEPAAKPEPVDTGSPWRFWFLVAALLFFIGYAVAFVVGNSKAISVDFVFATARVSLIWSVLLVLLVGVFAGVLASHLYRQRRSKKRGKP